MRGPPAQAAGFERPGQVTDLSTPPPNEATSVARRRAHGER